MAKKIKIVVRDLEKRSEIDEIITRCNPDPGKRAELEGFRDKHFEEGGERVYVHTNFPEIILIARYCGRVVGYVFFYQNCWEGNENNLITLAVRKGLNPSLAKIVRKRLNKEFNATEP